MPKLSELNPCESLTILLYGASGTGKTYFGGTAGSGASIINIGNGIETLLAPAFRNRYPNSDCNIISIGESRDKKGYLASATAFDQVCRTIDDLLVDPSVDTIIIDDCTFLRYYAMNKALVLNNDINMTQSLQTSRKHHSRVVHVADYGREMALVEEFISTYVEMAKAVKKHFIMIAHERMMYNKGKSIGDAPLIRKIVPGFTGQAFPDQVPGYFDLVWHSQVKRMGNKVIYEIRTNGDAITTGKTRQGGIVDETIIDPNFLTLLEKFKQSRKPHAN